MLFKKGETGMNNKEALIQAATALIEEKGDNLNEITVREICKRAGVGLGLLNYHFGNKDKLIEVCVERMINEIIARFQTIREKETALTPREKLEFLGNMTWDYLFAHESIARISILTDMQEPKPEDNTHRTYRAYLPLVAACRPDWDDKTVRKKTFLLVTIMQQTFLRHKIVSGVIDMDLTQKENRKVLHTRILHEILGG